LNLKPFELFWLNKTQETVSKTLSIGTASVIKITKTKQLKNAIKPGTSTLITKSLKYSTTAISVVY